MNRNSVRGTLYRMLKTHKAVEEFCFELSLAHKYQTNTILSSMWEHLESGRSLSFKQITYAQNIISGRCDHGRRNSHE